MFDEPGLLIVIGIFVIAPIIVFGALTLKANGFFDKFKRNKK